MKLSVQVLVCGAEVYHRPYGFEKRELAGWAEAVECAKRTLQQKHGLDCSDADASL
jgi:hypothetical protein